MTTVWTVVWILAGIFLLFILILGGIAAIAMFSRAPSGRGTGGRGGYFAGWMTRLPGAPAINYGFLWDFAAIMLGVVAVVWGIYLTHWAPQMFTFWGITGLLMFYGVIAAAIAASQARTGTVAKVTYRLALVAAIVVGTAEGVNVLYYRFIYCDTGCSLQKQEAAAAAAKLETERQLAIEEARYPGCDRQRVPVRFGTQPLLINRGGNCSYNLWYPGHCIFVKQPGDGKPLGPFCAQDKFAELPVDVESVWSADAPFDGFYQLSPPRYTRLFR